MGRQFAAARASRRRLPLSEVLLRRPVLVPFLLGPSSFFAPFFLRMLLLHAPRHLLQIMMNKFK